MGGNQAFMFARMKPRDQRTHSVDQIIEDLRPEGGRGSRPDDVHAESAADHDQRPAYDAARISSRCRA